MTQDTIRISASVARWMVAIARQLVSEAYGINWEPSSSMRIPDFHEEGVGFLDEIPHENHPLFFWADALVRFARVMGAIAARELAEPFEDIDILQLEDDGI